MIRNTKILDIFHLLQEYTNRITVDDPWTNADNVKHEHEINIGRGFGSEKIDDIILGVAYKVFSLKPHGLRG